MLGLAAGAVLAMGCSIGWKTGSGPAPSPAESTDAASTAAAIDVLRSGTKFIDQTGFRTDVDIAGQITTLTHTDNGNKRADSTVTAFGKTSEIRMIDNDVYMKTNAIALPGVSAGWMILDPVKMPPDTALSFAVGKNDPGGSARLIDAIVSARIVGTQVTGTMDLTKVGNGNGISFRPPANGTFPDSVKRQPFSAALDSQGRLVRFDIPAADGSLSAGLRYSDFGAAVAETRPPDAVPAPDALYAQLGAH